MAWYGRHSMGCAWWKGNSLGCAARRVAGGRDPHGSGAFHAAAAAGGRTCCWKRAALRRVTVGPSEADLVATASRPRVARRRARGASCSSRDLRRFYGPSAVARAVLAPVDLQLYGNLTLLTLEGAVLLETRRARRRSSVLGTTVFKCTDRIYSRLHATSLFLAHRPKQL